MIKMTQMTGEPCVNVVDEEKEMSYIENCDWEKCTYCGECLMKCPVMEMSKEEAKLSISRLIKGEPAARVMDECTFCFNCNKYCPVEGLRPHELILQRSIEHRGKVPPILKYLMNGQPPPNFFQDIYNSLSFGEKDILRRWSQTPPPSKEVLFVGCVGKMLCYDIENSLVLKDLPKFSPSDICCGELAYRLGNWDAYVDTIERALSRFQKLDIERMVCYCGSCYNYFSNILPNVYGKALPFKVTSMYNWMWEKVEKGELELKNPLNFRAAVHESCYVSELDGFAETLRNIYSAAGMDIVELKNHGDNNLSCGAMSVLRGINLPKTLLKEQRKKFKEVKSTGVNHVALNCPGCFITMALTAPFFGKKLRYMPDELLRAFGDNVNIPLNKRLSLIVKTFLTKGPQVLLQKGKSVLPRIQPGTPAGDR